MSGERERELKKLFFNARKTTLELLEDRDYEVSEELKNISYYDFKELFDKNKLDFLVDHKDEKDKQLYVYHHIDTKNFSKKDLVNLGKMIKDDYPTKITNVILIVDDNPTSQITKELTTQEYKNFEIFLLKELLINISKHKYQPKFEILTKEESEKVFKENGFNAVNCPTMLSTDPIAKYYGMKTGQLIKITRHSATTGESIYYRIVVGFSKK